MTAAGWIVVALSSGVWRCEHVASGSVIYVARTATEDEVHARLAEVTATIARLARRRIA